MLSNWIDFRSTIERIFVDPGQTLSWLDLSFNDLRTIDEVSIISIKMHCTLTLAWFVFPRLFWLCPT